MSTCWKCEKILPEGQVGCEDDCTPTVLDLLPASDGLTLRFHMELNLATSKLADPQKIAELQMAVARFNSLLGEIVVNSDLAEFCKRE